MMKKGCLLLIICIVAVGNLHAQTLAIDSVKATINQLFAAMLEADGNKLQQCFTDSAVMQTVTPKASG